MAEVLTDKARYSVSPTTGTALAPVRLRADSGAASIQDYFTAEQAIELGRALVKQGEAAKVQESGEAVVV